MFICEISIILICRKLGPVGPVQQKIKLPSPKGLKIYLLLGYVSTEMATWTSCLDPLFRGFLTLVFL